LVARTRRPLQNTKDAIDSLHILEGVSRIEEGGHEVMASLDHVDAGEAVTGQAKTPLGRKLRAPLLNIWLNETTLGQRWRCCTNETQISVPCLQIRYGSDCEIKNMPHEKILREVYEKGKPM
jgi:hypothetical protein